MIIVIGMLFIGGCNEEKKQGANLQAGDSLAKEISQKGRDTSTATSVFPGNDNFQQGCMFVQNQAETLLDEYYRTGTTAKRLGQIILELEHLNQQWKQMDCGQVFGYMIPRIPSLSGASKTVKH